MPEYDSVAERKVEPSVKALTYDSIAERKVESSIFLKINRTKNLVFLNCHHYSSISWNEQAILNPDKEDDLTCIPERKS